MTRATAPDYGAGETLPGTKYAVVRKLGEGAMGVVFEVVKPPDIRGVAKLMGTSFVGDAGFREKFLAEARILAQLDHPNIVRIFDYDVLSDGRPFFVMELLKGTPLDRVIGDRDKKTLPPRVAHRVMQQLLSALHCAHTHETPVVHRDVKPGNIFLHKPRHGGSVVKLLDFGVMTPANKMTIMAGTPGYAAPEQLRSDTVTARTDVYAAAVVLYEMLAGHGPFPLQESLGRDALLRATIEAPPERITRYAKWVPESVANALARALDKDPRNRPATAEAFLATLAELDRPDLFGDASELPWVHADPTPPPATVASLTAVVRSSSEASAAAAASRGNAERLAPTSPRRLDTFASHHSDASAIRRERSATRWRWFVAGGTGAFALLCAGIGVAVKWPRPAPAGLVAPAASPADVGSEIRSAPPPPEEPRETTRDAPAAAETPVAPGSPVAPTAPAVSAPPRAPAASPRSPAPPAPRQPTGSDVVSAPPRASAPAPKAGPTFEPTVGD